MVCIYKCARVELESCKVEKESKRGSNIFLCHLCLSFTAEIQLVIAQQRVCNDIFSTDTVRKPSAGSKCLV